MTCIVCRNAVVCVTPFYRLRLLDGRYVFMDWHSYFGPTFYRDRLSNREIKDWWKDSLLCRAVDWFMLRGCKT
jgi:hypothetical protein